MPDVNLLLPDFQHDPFPVLSACRDHQPIVQAADLPVWVLTRYDDVAAMRDEGVYTVAHIRMLREQIDGPHMLQMDGEEHKRNRALVAPGFRTKILAQFMDQEVKPLIDHLLEPMRGRGHAELMREFCEPLPFHTIAALLGLDVADQPRLSKLYKDAIAADPLQMGPEQMERSMAARAEFDKLLVPIVAERRANPRGDFVSQLVTAESRDGETLDDEHVLGFLRFMLPAGEESTMSALGTLVLELLRHPEQLDAVRTNPDLVRTAVEEGLRWRAPIAYINRLTKSEIVIDGVTIPEGSLVLGSVNAADRDPEAFPDPDTFDVKRDPNRHLAFGTGVHNCIGAPLARMELQMALPALLDALPNLRLAPGFEPRYDGLFSNALTELPVEFDPA